MVVQRLKKTPNTYLKYKTINQKQQTKFQGEREAAKRNIGTLYFQIISIYTYTNLPLIFGIPKGAMKQLMKLLSIILLSKRSKSCRSLQQTYSLLLLNPSEDVSAAYSSRYLTRCPFDNQDRCFTEQLFQPLKCSLLLTIPPT